MEPEVPEHLDLRSDDPDITYRITGLTCQHGKNFIKCPECINNGQEQIDKLKCIHQMSGIWCEFCYSLICVKGKKFKEFQPFLVCFCIDYPVTLESMKEVQFPFYKSLIEKHPNLITKQEPSGPSVSERKETPIETESEKNFTPQANNKSNDCRLGLEVKFKFSGSCKCQHNLEVTKCKKCNPKNLQDLKNTKCLHLISIIECNHCKNLILILRKERDKTRIKFISDKDYISFTEYDKIYLNPNQKKIYTSSNNKKRKTNPETDEPMVKDNNQDKSQSEGNKKEKIESEKQIGNNNKRDFKILESQEEMELEIPEQTKDQEKKTNSDKELLEKPSPMSVTIEKNAEGKPESEKTEEKTNKKPPPIFIVNEDLESIKEILIGYEIVGYTLKETVNKQIKMTLKTEEVYRKTLQKLHDLEIKFYTFQFPTGKTIKRIIRGLPVNYGIENIKSNFEEKTTGIIIKNIRQIYHVVTKNPLPLFEISFGIQNKLSEKLDRIKKLGNFDINLENLNPKFIDIPMCKSCLNYGHTKRFCSVGITCIICNGPHFSSECPTSLKAKEENTKVIPKCLHCKEPHFTTWKGCKYYKKLRKAKLDKFNQQMELKEDPVNKNGTPFSSDTVNEKNKEIRKLNNQITSLENKFEKEISLLNKTISLLKNELTNLSNKIKGGNTQKKNK